MIGDGPELPRLKAQFPDAVYVGFRFGDDLARHLAASDVFVFPSLTDTFGLVNLEAMACGVPVAAFPVAGPIDVVDVRPYVRFRSIRRSAASAHCARVGSCVRASSNPTWFLVTGNAQRAQYPRCPRYVS